MKKIFSFIATILCVASMMAAEPVGGELYIPNLVAGSIKSVTREGVELQFGDSVFEDETLIITYGAELPYFLTGDSVLTVTLTADMFEGSTSKYYQVPAPQVDRYYTVTFSTLEHATLTATLNDSAFTGGYALLGDTLVLNYVSTDALHWFFDANDAATWSDTIVLESYYFYNYVWEIGDPGMYKKNDYYINAIPDDHITYTVLINGDTLSEIYFDSIKGHIVHFGDTVAMCAYAAQGWRLGVYDTTVYCMEDVIAPYFFGPDSVMLLNLDAYMSEPEIIGAETVDQTTTRISWKGDLDNYEIRVATEWPSTKDERTWKGIHSVTGHEYLANNLTPGTKYYVMLRAVESDSVKSNWARSEFVANTNNCLFRIEMHDSYGDGWNGGALIFTENSKSDTITIEDGKTGEDYYNPNGDKVLISWISGDYLDEVSFTIYDGSDNILLKVEEGEASNFSNGEMLYEAGPCTGTKPASIGNITCKVDETGTLYTVNWQAYNAKSYEIVVTQDTALTEEQLAQQAISRKVRAYSFEIEKPFSFYYVYVRGINEDGEASRWRKQLIYDVRPITELNMMEMLAQVQQIQLDYHKHGSLFADALAYCENNDTTAALAYTFTLTDTALFSVAYRVSNSMMMMGPSTTMHCSKLGTGKDGLSIEKVFTTKSTYYSDTLSAGQYLLLISNEISNLGEYDIDIRLNNAPTDSIEFIDFQLDYADTANFVNAQNVVSPMSRLPMPTYVYRFTPTDTVSALLTVESASDNVSMFVIQQGAKLSLKFARYGKTYLGDFEKDSTYIVFVFNNTLTGGQPEDSFIFTAKQIKNDSINIIPISTDTVIIDEVGLDQYQPKAGMYQQFYEFEVAKPTRMSVFIEEAPSEPVSTSGPGFIVMPTKMMLSMAVFKDSLNTMPVYTDDLSNDSYHPFSCSPDTTNATHYYVVVSCTDSTDYKLTVRAEVDYDSIGGPLVQVGEMFNGQFDTQDRPAYHIWQGIGEGVRVQLEKGKHYVATLHTANYLDGMELSVMKPGVKDTLFDNNVLISDHAGDGDDWRAISFQADTTAEFSFLLDVKTENYKRFDSIPFEFMVVEDIPFDDYIAQLDTVEAPFYEQGKMLKTDVKVRYSDPAYFHPAYSYMSDIAGVWGVAGRAVNVPAGDTLFVEFVGEANAQIHVITLDSTGYHTDVIDDEYVGVAEHYEVINDDSIAHTYFILGSFIEDIQEEHNYVLRFGLGEKSMDLMKASARVSASSITVKRSAGIADIQAELLKLSIEAYDEQNNLIATIENSLDWWTIDEANNEATFETNNTDLPLGFEYADGTEYLKVSINRKKPATVTAKASADTITVAADATEAIIRAELAKLTLKVYTGSDKVVMNVTNNAQLWKINEEDNVATYEVKNEELPNLDDYTFSNGSGRITVYIKRQKDQGIDEVLANSDKAEKVLIDGQIYIIRDGKLYTIMGQLVR